MDVDVHEDVDATQIDIALCLYPLRCAPTQAGHDKQVASQLQACNTRSKGRWVRVRQDWMCMPYDTRTGPGG